LAVAGFVETYTIQRKKRPFRPMSISQEVTFAPSSCVVQASVCHWPYRPPSCPI
jgi:hypothetical protein